jgi:lipopolysaccharide export system protein LptC
MNRFSLDMGRAGGIMLLALLLSAGTFWLWHFLTREAPNLPNARRHTPDYYIIDMVRHTMDRNGDLQNVLMADEVYHYPDDNSTELTRPRMEIYNEEQNPWEVVAERGTLKANTDLVVLHGRVEIWRLDDAGQREFEIITSELRVFPNVEYAETDNAATIRSFNSVTKTKGFRANFGHHRLELRERVRSHIERH